MFTTAKIGHFLVQEIKVSFLIEQEIWREVTTILVKLVTFEYVYSYLLFKTKEEIVTIETTKSHDLHAIWKR